MNIAEAYQQGLQGWAGPELARREFDMLAASGAFHEFRLLNRSSFSAKRMMLFDVTRKLLGKDTPNYAQQIGDCVSFGVKNAIEYLQAVEILLNRDAEGWKPIFPPYIYGISRVQIGGGRLSGDGSLGSWGAEAVKKYGVLRSDERNVPAYAGSVAKKWGNRPGPPTEFIEIASKHLVKSAAPIKSVQQLCDAICAGYPCTVASMQGFEMKPDSKGFHRATGQWSHQMCATPEMVISCINNIKKIKDVKVGDEIVGHDGQLHNVINTIQRQYVGKIIKIHVYGHETICVTPNHPILVYREDNKQVLPYAEENIDNIAVIVKNKIRTTWVKAKDITKSDWVVSPLSQFNYSNLEKIPDWVFISTKCKNIPDHLFIDDELAWLFGLYIADGNSTKKHKIVITLNKHEVNIANRAVQAIAKIGLEARILEKRNCLRVVTYSAIVAESFKQWFGDKINKHIPDWVISNYNISKVLEGIYHGDGLPINNTAKRIVNTSKRLIYQCRDILLRLGMFPCINLHKYNPPNDNWKDRYYVQWHNNSQYSKIIEDYRITKVYSIEEENYDGLVYNLEVEGCRSYTLNGLATHNCIIGIDMEYSDPYIIILNSWGEDAHGELKDFNTGETLPGGVIRARISEIERSMIGSRDAEVFALGQFDGFPDNRERLDKALFKMI